MLMLLLLWVFLSCSAFVLIVVWEPARKWAEAVTSEDNLKDDENISLEGRALCAFLLPASIAFGALDGFDEEGRSIVQSMWSIAAFGRDNA